MSSSTREALMRTAEQLLRSKGYAAFSYADLALAVGIRKASIHYHFPTKEDLGVAVVESYIERVEQALMRIERERAKTAERLESFALLFTSGVEEGLLPLCGALAAEMAALPECLQVLAKNFLQLQCRWLKKILDDGVLQGEISPGVETEKCAHNILCQMEGVSLVNWTLDKSRNFDPSVLRHIVGLKN
jgi:TetR/AcrR family transcriptional repressor of nem operon